MDGDREAMRGEGGDVQHNPGPGTGLPVRSSAYETPPNIGPVRNIVSEPDLTLLRAPSAFKVFPHIVASVI